jgi:exopolysaccharide biosynthesis polyprenyl glycosylphosphotransferase
VSALLTHPKKPRQLFLLVGDTVVLASLLPLVFEVRADLLGTFGFIETLEGGWLRFVVLILAYLSSFYVFGLYDPPERFYYLRTLSTLTFAALLILAGFGSAAYLVRSLRVGRSVLVAHAVLSVVLLFLWRRVAFALRPLAKGRRILCFGVPAAAVESIRRELRKNGLDHYQVTALSDPGEMDPEAIGAHLQTSHLQVVVNLQRCPEQLVDELLRLRFVKGVDLLDYPAFFSSLTGQVPAERHAVEAVAFDGRLAQFNGLYLRTKRFVDVVVCSLAFIVLLPLMAVIAVAIKLTSPGPVLYRQERIGYLRQPITVLKFRTMVQHAEADTGPVWAKKGDPRVTLVGRFLRRTALDELPQLINVLRGEMSMVGFRPIRAVFEEQAEAEIPFYPLRYAMKPGLTGWSQVMLDDPRTETGPLERFQYDLYYLTNASAQLDLLIILKTFKKLVTLGGR